ncbi:hypothetical protein [Microbacterium sp. bgisy203]|uniref:hypothetical protein n=1 Tax=Microbacterium sp. bgisy203 TaxID=3413799 RepID=UPI003D70DC90
MTPKTLPSPYQDDPDAFPVAQMKDPAQIAEFLERAGHALLRAAKAAQQPQPPADPIDADTRTTSALEALRIGVAQTLLARRIAIEWALEHTSLTQRGVAALLGLNQATTYRYRHNVITNEDVAEAALGIVPRVD